MNFAAAAVPPFVESRGEFQLPVYTTMYIEKRDEKEEEEEGGGSSLTDRLRHRLNTGTNTGGRCGKQAAPLYYAKTRIYLDHGHGRRLLLLLLMAAVWPLRERESCAELRKWSSNYASNFRWNLPNATISSTSFTFSRFSVR